MGYKQCAYCRDSVYAQADNDSWSGKELKDALKDIPAHGLVTGYVDGRPFKAYLCNDHYTTLCDDGEKVKGTIL